LSWQAHRQQPLNAEKKPKQMVTVAFLVSGIGKMFGKHNLLLCQLYMFYYFKLPKIKH